MPKFVVQEHAATHLHWDFRLELDGTGKSWAVPKKPPKKPGIKRLAIRVSNHPLSYFSFEGVIPEGYGAGTVKIWDHGKYKLLERTKGKMVLMMKGKKLKGIYHMRAMTARNWLLYKAADYE